MSFRIRRWLLVLFAVVASVGCGYVWYFPYGLTLNFPGSGGAPIPKSEVGQRLHVPDGFSIVLFAQGVKNARMLRFTDAGDLLVSSPRDGAVILLERDANHDGVADGQRGLLSGLKSPHGLALRDRWLYVAEGDAVLRVRFDAATRQTSGDPERFIVGLPAGGNHWTRTIGIGPDDHLYVSVGSSCNVCIEQDPRRAAILRYNLDGTGEQVYASGLRNAVGFAWQPGTHQLYATDNGRDLLGDDFPPCEFNRVVEGASYGWPFANGDRIPDPDRGAGHADAIAASIPPAHGLGAHTAPLGMTFYTGTTFPEPYRGAAFVAQHGSWNRSRKSGYQVVALIFNDDGTIREEPFLTGFEENEDVIGRPVDVAVGPDGALYVSDDFTGSIYRVAYGAAPSGAAPAVTAAVGTKADPLATLRTSDRDAAARRGAELWQANGCASCHVPGHGPEPHRPISHLATKYDISSLIGFLRTPQPPMPQYPFSDAERRDLAVFLFREHP